MRDIAKKRLSLTPDWIVGFVDAEGHFSVIQIANTNRLRCRFVVSQDIRSVHVLHAMKDFFGVGKIHAGGGTMYNYTVDVLEDLRSVIIPFFEKHTLQSQKYYDWLKFRYALQSKFRSKSERAHSSVDINSVKLFFENSKKESIPSRPITKDWFIGFMDGDGCLRISIIQPKGKVYHQVINQLVIGTHSRDSLLCERIQSFLGCGTISFRKDGFVIFQVSKREDLLIRVLPLFYINGRYHTLQTHKRRRASLFWRILKFVVEGNHRTEEGLRLIKLWREKMRFPKKS